jgi:hypothetical protein
MQFRTPSLHPRNPSNQATEFERWAQLAFDKDKALAEFGERTMAEGHEVMRDAQPVRIGKDCLQCHEDPRRKIRLAIRRKA